MGERRTCSSLDEGAAREVQEHVLERAAPDEHALGREAGSWIRVDVVSPSSV